MEKLFTDEELGYLPLGFQFFVKPPEGTESLPPGYQEKEKFVKIDYYQTDKYKVHMHYKPLSKIITHKNDSR